MQKVWVLLVDDYVGDYEQYLFYRFHSIYTTYEAALEAQKVYRKANHNDLTQIEVSEIKEA